MHSSLSYDKWNDLDDSDDEEPAPGKPIEAKLESRKANSEIDRDNATHKRMVEYHKLHYKNGENKDLVPPSQIDMMARLIAISSSLRLLSVFATGMKSPFRTLYQVAPARWSATSARRLR